MKDRKLLMIPGPIEFEPAVLSAMAMPTTSHVDPRFIECFGKALEDVRQVFKSKTGQPFVVAGSGTLAMDMAAANLVEPADRALVVSTGYFSERFVDILERYGAKVEKISAEIGAVPDLEKVERALCGNKYKLVTVTQVDTSTGVAAPVEELAALCRRFDVLYVVDGVCGAGGMDMQQEDWGVDIYLTASQKAIGVPPGLAILVASGRAMEIFVRRRTPVNNYYADFHNWLPIMQAYEARQPSYFGTPPVNLIYALNESLKRILAEGLTTRFHRHRLLSNAFKAGLTALGLKQVPLSSDIAAPTMTAAYYPEGVDASLVKAIAEEGVIVAGGLHPAIKNKYFRIGHMGAVTAGDILTTLGAIEVSLASQGYRFEPGLGLAAAGKILAPKGMSTG